MRGTGLGLLACILITAARPAGAETIVSFAYPEQFTDAALDGGSGLAAEQPTLSAIAGYLVTLGASELGPHQTLTVEVTNIDLAGQFEPWRALAHNVRVMRDVYPPRIALRFRLIDNGLVSAEGEAALVDVNYLANPSVRLIPAPLRYEKAMLAGWFHQLPLGSQPTITGMAPAAR
jgi:Protein of unknown function (DUF3016)